MNILGDYIAVNYHYVRNSSEKWRGIFPCSIEEFERQVKFLSREYRIVSVLEAYESAQKEKEGKFCAITFDDGLKDHYQNVLPILKKYNVIGTFFIITSTFDGYLPNTHKTHILLSKLSSDELINKFNDYLSENYSHLKEEYWIPKDRRIEDKRAFDDIPTTNFKETLIATLPEIREGFLSFCFGDLNLNKIDLAKQFFMSEEEALEIYKEGMILGNHTHHHHTYDLVTEELLRKDLQLSNKVLNKIDGDSIDIFSYPNGRSSDLAVKVLKEEGISYATTIKKRDIKKGDDPFLIPRYDTNNIKDYLNQI